MLVRHGVDDSLVRVSPTGVAPLLAGDSPESLRKPKSKVPVSYGSRPFSSDGLGPLGEMGRLGRRDENPAFGGLAQHPFAHRPDKSAPTEGLIGHHKISSH